MNFVGLAIHPGFTLQKQGTYCCVLIFLTGKCSGGGGRCGNCATLQKPNCLLGQTLRIKHPLGMSFNIEIITGLDGAACAKMKTKIFLICLFTVVSSAVCGKQFGWEGESVDLAWGSWLADRSLKSYSSLPVVVSWGI